MSSLLQYYPLIRKRGGGDLESVLRHHEELQEEVAKDMIDMARSLRDNSLVAKKIILSDNEVSTTCSTDE